MVACSGVGERLGLRLRGLGVGVGSGGGSEALGRLLREPRRGELPLDVLAVEEVAEDELVFGDGVLREHERERPLDGVVEGEGVEARRPLGALLRVRVRLGLG